jgi:uncharacterized hydrophobic protein (TIGR00271 family)
VGKNASVLELKLSVPTELSEQTFAMLDTDPAISSLTVVRGASTTPVGDLIVADVAREAADSVMADLLSLGIHKEGTIRLNPVRTWVSQTGYLAEERAPGSSADAVVWPEVTQQAYGDSELNWTYLSFMCLATLIASVAIVLDSQVLLIGAMVLGPEFGAVAALGLALVRRRPGLFRQAVRTLVIGFVVAIAFAFLATMAARLLGWVTAANLLAPRPGTAFVYTPDKWSFVVALVAGAAGVLSLTSSKAGGMAGVFISVTTIPAAGNVALGLAFGAWSEVGGSALQLALNLTGMAIAGWLTLIVQHQVWTRVSAGRERWRDKHGRNRPTDTPLTDG